MTPGARAGLVVLAACLGAFGPGAEADDLTRIEDEFEKAIKRVAPATVIVLPHDVGKAPTGPGSSAVMITKDGVLLSDGDAGTWFESQGEKKRPKQRWKDQVEIRIPNLKGKGFKTYAARVLARDRKLDTSLIRIDDPPSRGFEHLELGSSDDLRVGDFTFVMGNSFGLAAEAPPTITAGVVCGLIEGAGGDGGRYETIYTSAAVNPGVNGGPVVDAEGRLVGTVSTYVGPTERFQYMGKIVPIARLRAHYRGVEEAREVFASGRPGRARSRRAADLELVFHRTARRALRGVVSIEVARKEGKPLSHVAPGVRGMVMVPRYLGAFSGVLVDAEGHVVTSLYNLANLSTVVNPAWAGKAPGNAKVGAGITSIESVTVHLAQGHAVPASILGYSETANVALLKCEVDALPEGVAPLERAPADELEPGRFVLAIGNPYGGDAREDPLLTVGVLSKEHVPHGDKSWAGQWQTDAGVTDANCGGAAVDLRGRLLGMLVIWSPMSHGRNSGIGFVAPWTQIEPMLEPLKAGKRPPWLGISWRDGPVGIVVDRVVGRSPAAQGGLEVGDIVLAIDGTKVARIDDARAVMATRWSGDTIQVRVERGRDEKTLTIVLGKRP